MNSSETQAESIAVIGMAGRFPGAQDLEHFWRNLRDGVESVSFFKNEELQWSLLDGPPPTNNPNLVKARAVLDNSEWFDAAFFSLNPVEAEILDPQHRVFLECAWEALENAGYNPDTFDGLIGLFAGTSMSTYLLSNLLTNPDRIRLVGAFQAMLATDKDYLPTRVSYKLNLRGPSVNVQTACSTSLVAVCLACQNLLNYQCDIALAGGVSITFPPKKAQLHQEGGIISPDGHCRAFDAQAAGTVSGDGVGIVALKRLSDAVAAGDHICAVIKGCAINNDGSLKIGYTAPSVEGQAEVIAMAQANSGIEPETISYIETHGTGTPLGDPIEIAGLTRAFRAGTAAKGFCAIGSVKSNIGHLDAAAGIAGLIKTVLALQHQQLPPSLHFRRSNPKIDFANSPFFVNDQLREWSADHTPRRAGVSSFGIGGTNAHVVLEEAPATELPGKSRPCHLVVLSARSASALETATARLVEHLKANPGINPADVAFTLQVGRKPFDHRRVVVCQSVADATQTLATPDSKRVLSGQVRQSEPPVVFMFPGQGAQHVNMGRPLYETEPVFREHVDRCSEILKAHLELDLRTLLYSGPDRLEQATAQLSQTFVTQPALFVIEYALARLWMHWGIRPRAMIGHSVGEYVAACLAEVFSLEDALALVAARGRLVQKQPTGAMLAIRLPAQEIKALLGRRLSLAAINGPSLCVASGPFEAIESLEKKLAERGAAFRRLQTSHAFHSEMMEPVLHWLAAKVRKVKLNPPRIPYIANLTGTWVTEQEATDPNCWTAHLRQTVRFADGLAELARDESRILVEVGPGHTLSTLARQHPGFGPAHLVVPSFHPANEKPLEGASLLNALGRLWLEGVTVNWTAFSSHERRYRLPLPTYPFERKRYWVEPAGLPPRASSGSIDSSTHPVQSPVHDDWKNPAPEKGPAEAKPKPEGNDTLSKLKAVFQTLSGLDLSHASASATFLELGFDSLFLTQASQAVQARFGVNVTFRQLLEAFPSLEKLTAWIDAQSADAGQPALSPPTPTAPRTNQSSQDSIVCGDGPVKAGVKTVSLTDAQREIWFATQMGAAVSAAYNESCTVCLRGPLQVEALRRAIQQLIGRHEALRTTFSPSGDVQRIAANAKLDVPLVDFSSQQEADREPRVAEIIDREVGHEFDLVNGPLLRAQIVRLPADDHRLIIVAHHLICDGWSMSVLLCEVGDLYTANCRGTPCGLTAPMQFSEYARQEAERRSGPESAASEAYWVGQFSDSVPVLELPANRPRPAARNYTGSHRFCALGGDLVSAVKRFSAAHNCTTFTTLLAAFNVLLHRLSGQDDIVVGAPAAGQLTTGAQHLVGHCANLLPLRSRIHARQKFGDYLETLRPRVLEAFEHHRFPFGSLIGKLNLPRDPNRVPLANVTFNVGRARGALNFDGLAASVARNPRRFANFDINFNVTETDEGLSLDCYYSSELFDDATILRLLRQFEQVLTEGVSHPERPLDDLALLSEGERHQVVVEWNNTAADYPRNACIHQLFEAQVERTPQATALICGTDRLTYQELNQRAETLARQLQDLGAGLETLVGVCVERSPAMVVSLLAILKSAAAYVPVDPAYPRERLAFVLEDTRAPLLLTQDSLRNHFQFEIPNLSVLCLDTQGRALPASGRATIPHPIEDGSEVRTMSERPESEAPSEPIVGIERLAATAEPGTSTAHGPLKVRENPARPGPGAPRAASPENLSYVIYTSGSTGKPKGVCIEHRSAVAFIHWAHSVFTSEELAGVLASTSICFDLSVFELFVPLCRGGTAILADNLLELPGLPARREVTLINTVPSAITELLRMGGIPESVRTVNLAGEPLSTGLVQQLYNLRTIQKVYDLYGPSEDTTYSTYALRSPNGPATIGRPIANTQVYLLDHHLHPVPPGVPGELCVAGDGLARGYWNRPALTAEKFIANPFGCRLGARLYKTGDLARYSPDANIEFLGRIDHQVKIRGFRIEPGEIESVLGQNPAVSASVVVARQDGTGDKRLVAYVAARPAASLSSSGLRDFLKGKLPEHMVPSALVLLEKLPLTPNGKVDRKQLPAPDGGRPELDQAWAAPSTTVEEALAKICRAVLGLDRVGVHDNFFELGGHSLLVTQVLTRVREAFNVELSLRRFFEAPTIAELAVAIEEKLVQEIQELSDEEAARLAEDAELAPERT